MAAGAAPERVVLSVLPALYAGADPTDLGVRVATAAITALGADKCDITVVDRVTGDFRVIVWPEPTELHALAEARDAVMHTHPALPHFLRGDERAPRSLSDFLSAAEYRRTALYGEFFGPLAVADQLTVLVSAPGARTALAVSVDRSTRGFTRRDRQMLSLLAPHLRVAWANASVRSGRSSAIAEQRAATLTAREREVWDALAAGVTNREIAGSLGVAEGTARKHVEHLLERLEVHTRTAAAVLHTALPVDPLSTGPGGWTAERKGMMAAVAEGARDRADSPARAQRVPTPVRSDGRTPTGKAPS